jgi:hypothetical protein
VIRFLLASLVLASPVACTAVAAVPTPAEQLSRQEVVSPSPSPRFEPGPASAGGIVTRIDAHGVVVRNPDGELEVDLTDVRSVWKETEVSPLDLEIGDELFLNGFLSGATFHARYVSANIGRIDGVIRTIVGVKLELVRLPPKTSTFQMKLSRFVDVVSLDGSSATIADLRPGMTVGAVVYQPKNATMRATKIWF